MITKAAGVNGLLIIGEAEDIKATYRSMCKAYCKNQIVEAPLYTNFPKFTEGKLYAIQIWDEDSYAWQDRCVDSFFRVINSDTIARELVHIIDATRLR